MRRLIRADGVNQIENVRIRMEPPIIFSYLWRWHVLPFRETAAFNVLNTSRAARKLEAAYSELSRNLLCFHCFFLQIANEAVANAGRDKIRKDWLKGYYER